MEVYTDINSKEVLKRVLVSLTHKIECLEHSGNYELAKAFLKRKQRIWNRLQKIERGEIPNDRRKVKRLSDKDPSRRRRSDRT